MTMERLQNRVSRRDAVRLSALAGAGAIAATGASTLARAQDSTPTPGEDGTPVLDQTRAPGAQVPASEVFAQAYPYSLPLLPYELGDLDPTISEETNEIHYNTLHANYIDGLNAALQEVTVVQGLTIEELLQNLALVPNDLVVNSQGVVKPLQEFVATNAGGHYNHSLWWASMSPDGGGEPTGAIAEAITTAFGDFATMQEAFRLGALGNTGSGWVWLVADAAGALTIVTTPDQDNPIATDQGFPIFGIDNWEHNYFLDYGAARGDFIDAWWDVVDWEFIGSRYDRFMTTGSS